MLSFFNANLLYFFPCRRLLVLSMHPEDTLHVNTVLSSYSGTSHNGPSHEETTSLLRTLVVAPNEITTELVFNQPPTSGCFLIPDSGQAVCS